MSTHEVRRCSDAVALATEVAAAVAETARAAVASRGRFVLALAGGETPRATHAALAARDDVPWESLTLLLGDERCVPADDPRSNARMVRETLLAPLAARAPERALPCLLAPDGADPDPQSAARRYDALLREHAPHVDLALLGLGSDGHTASVFSDSPLLEDDGGRLAAAAYSAATATWRVTLTPSALRAARARWFLVVGAAKAPILAAVLAPGCTLPAARIGPSRFFTDAARRTAAP